MSVSPAAGAAILVQTAYPAPAAQATARVDLVWTPVTDISGAARITRQRWWLMDNLSWNRAGRCRLVQPREETGVPARPPPRQPPRRISMRHALAPGALALLIGLHSSALAQAGPDVRYVTPAEAEVRS